VAILERGHPNLEMGPRHEPLAAAFMNGTVKGKDVWVSMDQVLGGQERCGYGWHMFVECLAEGRGVSLPASGVSIAKGLGPAVGAYARARKQFRVPIAEFGGVQEALAVIASDGYISVASTELMNAIVDNHEAPMVLSSIMKQNITNRARTMVTAGMDILGGSAISMGPKNIIGQAWMTMPIAITVEGANIMTRSFQIIGQGLMRCHPHLLNVVESLEADDKAAPQRFMAGVGQMVGHALGALGSSLVAGVRDAAMPFSLAKAMDASGPVPVKKDDFVAKHEKALLRLSANFAFAADLALLLGGRLKFEEMFMGRLADALGAVFLGYTVLVHYERNAHTLEKREELQRVAHHALLRLEKEAHDALMQAADNVPKMPMGVHHVAGAMLRLAVRPLGGLGAPDRLPGDALTKQVAELLTLDSEYSRSLLVPGVCTADGTFARTLLDALPKCIEADSIAIACKKAKREPTAAEQAKIRAADDARDEIVQVSAFEKVGHETHLKDHVRPALAQTAEWLEALKREPKRMSAALA
jgi:acyl-CoA dehydrogenase